jgi:hypothetical protein
MLFLLEIKHAAVYVIFNIHKIIYVRQTLAQIIKLMNCSIIPLFNITFHDRFSTLKSNNYTLCFSL